MAARFRGGHPRAGGAGKAEGRHPEGKGSRGATWSGEPAADEPGTEPRRGEHQAIPEEGCFRAAGWRYEAHIDQLSL